MPWMRFIPQDKDPNQKKKSVSEKASVELLGGTSGECINTPVKINALRTGAIIKVPVVLAELTLQLDIDALVNLPMVAGEIKDIKNNIKVSQCRIIQRTNKLFVKGFVSQTIEYKTTTSIYDGKVETLKQCKVEIPFSCTTSVNYNGGEPLEPIPNDSAVFEYNVQPVMTVGGRGCEESEDTLEQNRIITENFNELPYCQLITSRIVESDRYLNYGNNLVKGKSIKSIEEKMVLYLTIKILQNQQIDIMPIALKAKSNTES